MFFQYRKQNHSQIPPLYYPIKTIRIRICNLCAQIKGRTRVIPGLLSGNNFPIKNGNIAVTAMVEMAWQLSDCKRLHPQLSN